MHDQGHTLQSYVRLIGLSKALHKAGGLLDVLGFVGNVHM